MVELLKEKFKAEIEEKKLILVEGYILEFEIESYKLLANGYKLIANIPYNITGAILKKFLGGDDQPERMVLMVQHEVAKRIMARDSKESLLSISVRAYGEPKLVMKVAARYFSPAPKVDSAIIAINNISRRIFSTQGGSASGGEDARVLEEKFWEVVKAGFAHKRKKLSGNLKNFNFGLNFWDQPPTLGLKNKRAEDLSLSEWLLLAQALK